ncbi:hypothetical protein D3C81_1858720 [compost metagenome]
MAAAQQRTQVVALGGEQAQVQAALGRQADAAAIATERVGHARNHADFAGAIAIPPALGRLARVVGRNHLERKHFVNPPHHVGGR